MNTTTALSVSIRRNSDIREITLLSCFVNVAPDEVSMQILVALVALIVIVHQFRAFINNHI